MISTYRKKVLYRKKNKIKPFAEKNLTHSRICANISQNNVIISLTDLNGDVITNISPGTLGYKNNQKLTPFAIKNTARELAGKAQILGVKTVDVIFKGTTNLEPLLLGLSEKLTVNSLREVSGIAFNGVRAKSKRSK